MELLFGGGNWLLPAAVALLSPLSFLVNGVVRHSDANAAADDNNGPHFFRNFYLDNESAFNEYGGENIEEIFKGMDALEQEVMFAPASPAHPTFELYCPNDERKQKKLRSWNSFNGGIGPSAKRLLKKSQTFIGRMSKGLKFAKMSEKAKYLIKDLKVLMAGGEERIIRQVMGKKLAEGAEMLRELCGGMGLDWDHLEGDDGLPAEGGLWALVRGLLTAWQGGDGTEQREWFWQRLPLYKRMFTDSDSLLRLADLGGIGGRKGKSRSKRRRKRFISIAVIIAIVAVCAAVIFTYFFITKCLSTTESSNNGNTPAVEMSVIEKVQNWLEDA